MNCQSNIMILSGIQIYSIHCIIGVDCLCRLFKLLFGEYPQVIKVLVMTVAPNLQRSCSDCKNVHNMCMIINVNTNVAMLMWLEPDNNVGIMAAVYQCGDA